MQLVETTLLLQQPLIISQYKMWPCATDLIFFYSQMDLLCRKADHQDHHNASQQHHYCTYDDCTSVFVSLGIEIHKLAPRSIVTIVTSREEKKRIATVYFSTTQFSQLFSDNNVPLIDTADDGTTAESMSQF